VQRLGRQPKRDARGSISERSGCGRRGGGEKRRRNVSGVKGSGRACGRAVVCFSGRVVVSVWACGCLVYCGCAVVWCSV
jgi:hypothetical protein